MHRLTATDTPMVRYTRTIFPSYALVQLFFHFKIHDIVNKTGCNQLMIVFLIMTSFKSRHPTF